MPLVSVIIPTYNRPLLVQQAIESVLAQQGALEFEIVVIDDGSSDDTEAALQKYAGAVRYIKRTNAGLNPSRNHALGLINGEYVAFLDDDDVWLPHKTQVQLAALAQYPHAGFVHSNFFIWKPAVAQRADGLATWFPRPFQWAELYPLRTRLQASDTTADYDAYCGDIYFWSLLMPMVLPSTAIVRRAALIGGVKFPEFDSTGDWEFFARLSKNNGGAVFVAADMVLNRSHEDATRLTRTDPAVRLRRRIAMIHRVWRQDRAFAAAHREQIDKIESQCLRKLTRLCIGSGRHADARAALGELRQYGGLSLHDYLLTMLSYTPYAHRAVDALRRMRATIGAVIKGRA